MNANELSKIRVFSLGHHGSKHSSGDHLLRKLPKGIIAVVSARKSRYGHPHKQTRKRLKKYQIPLLQLEDWGTIIYRP